MKKLFLLLVLFSVLSFSQSHNTMVESDDYSGAIASVISESGEYRLTADKRGQVYLAIYDGFDFSKVGVVLDIRDEVASFGELGLTTIVLDQNFDVNFQYWIYYPVERQLLFPDSELSLPTIGRVTRYTLDIDNLESYNRNIVLGATIANGIPVTDNNHFGGTLTFGSDGTLLLSTGETGIGSTARAIEEGIMRQAEQTRKRALLRNGANGKVLRFDKETGLGITSNPFYDSENPDIPESKVWAMGFRNPFRMFNNTDSGSTNPEDANVGTLFIADVGAGNWEEITVLDKPALNGGWRLYESFDELNEATQLNLDTGVTFQSEYIEPTSFQDSEDLNTRVQTHKYPSIAYPHFNRDETILLPEFTNGVMTPIIKDDFVFEGLSVIAGVVVKGVGFGEDMEGNFIFGDVFSTRIISAKNGDFNQLETVIDSEDLSNVLHYVQHPISGDIYATTLGGKIVKIFFDETLSTNEFVFRYDLATPLKHYSLSGKTIPYLKHASDGIYITVFSYEERVQSKKQTVKNGKIISR